VNPLGEAARVVELDETPAPGRLREALARALGGPSLEVAYWLRDDTFVDANGHVVSLPAVGSGRVATTVARSGVRVAALVHEWLSDHPELVDGVVAAAGLALENERLQAQLRARLRTCGRRGRGSSRPPTTSGGGSSATFTMARSSGW
jgi:hypothetical protein